MSLTGMRDLVVTYLNLPYHERIGIQIRFDFKFDRIFKSNQENDLAFFESIKKANRLLEFGAHVEERVAKWHERDA